MFRLLSCIFALAVLSSCCDMAHGPSQCPKNLAEQAATQPEMAPIQPQPIPQEAALAPAANTPVVLPFPSQPVVQTPFAPAVAPEPARSFLPPKTPATAAPKTGDSWLHL